MTLSIILSVVYAYDLKWFSTQYRAPHRSDSLEPPTDSVLIQLGVLTSGAIMLEVLRAQEILAERFRVAADVWSVTSYPLLRRQALSVERWNTLHPGEEPRQSYVARQLSPEPWPVIAASDSMKALPDMIARWTPAGLYPLGTDGFGRSDAREDLRRFFEIDAEHIALACLSELARHKQMDRSIAAQAVFDLGLDPTKPNPTTC